MSEAERIGRLADRFGRVSDPRLLVPSGDDAAVVRAGGALIVTSVDAVVEGVHFTLPEWPLRAVGRKAVGAALSDLAAMGARAGEVYVAAGIPRSFDEHDFDALTEGIAAAADASGAIVAGGDLSSAGELFVSVTVTGYVDDAHELITRDGARPGDLVFVTGELGGAAAALELIADGAAADDPRLTKQFAHEPRFAAGRALAANGATAMLDVSDGLVRDAGHIARLSGVAINIEQEWLPCAQGVSPVLAASSGEEYELLATIPPERAEAATAAVTETGVRLTRIGRVAAGAGTGLVDASGAAVEVRGFDHFD